MMFFIIYKKDDGLAYKVNPGLDFKHYYFQLTAKYRIIDPIYIKKRVPGSFFENKSLLNLIKGVGSNKPEFKGESPVKTIANNLLFNHFKPEKGFLISPEERDKYGTIVDLAVRNGLKKLNPSRNNLVILEAKSQSGDPWHKLMAQGMEYSRNTYIGRGKSCFFIALKGTYIAFFVVDPKFHYENQFIFKGEDSHGLIGLVCYKGKVQPLPQKDIHIPQMYPFDLNSKNLAELHSIHYILS